MNCTSMTQALKLSCGVFSLLEFIGQPLQNCAGILRQNVLRYNCLSVPESYNIHLSDVLSNRVSRQKRPDTK